MKARCQFHNGSYEVLRSRDDRFELACGCDIEAIEQQPSNKLVVASSVMMLIVWSAIVLVCVAVMIFIIAAMIAA